MHYPAHIEVKMKRYFERQSEKERRGYAAIEAAKLGHGGVEYVSKLFEIDAKTVRRGLQELEQLEDEAPGRVRKKGGVERP
jgi:hypothetical protein